MVAPSASSGQIYIFMSVKHTARFYGLHIFLCPPPCRCVPATSCCGFSMGGRAANGSAAAHLVYLRQSVLRLQYGFALCGADYGEHLHFLARGRVYVDKVIVAVKGARKFVAQPLVAVQRNDRQAGRGYL